MFVENMADFAILTGPKPELKLFQEANLNSIRDFMALQVGNPVEYRPVG